MGVPRRLIAALMTVSLVDEGVGFLPDGSIESIRTDLGLSYTWMTVILMTPALAAIPSVWLTSRLDRGNRRPILVGAALLLVASFACFAAASTRWWMLVAALGWGVSSTVMGHGVDIVLTDVAGDELHRALRWQNLLSVIGDIASPLLLAMCLGLGWSWRTAFWIAAALCAAYALLLASAPIPLPVHHDDSSDEDDDERPLWRDSLAWRLGLIALLTQPFDELWLGLSIALAQREANVSPGWATTIGAIAMFGAVLGFGPIGKLTEGAAPRRVLTTMAVALGASSLLAAGAQPLAIIAAAIIVNAAAAGGYTSLQHAALTLRPGQSGRTMALVVTLEQFSLGFPVMFGAIADAVGLQAVFLAYGALGIALIFMVRTLPPGARMGR